MVVMMVDTLAMTTVAKLVVMMVAKWAVQTAGWTVV